VKLLRSLKQARDRFIDNVVMQRSAFKKARHRLRQQENVYAYVAKDENGLKFLYAPTDFTIGAALIERGGWQYDELNHYLEFISERANGKNACFFDIGANIGTQTVYAARSGLFSTVFAIEAVPAIYELLSANVVLNDCGDRTIVFNKALGAENCQQTFLFNRINPGGSRRDDGSADCEEVLLDVVKTSDFVQGLLDTSGKPDILVFWIDVEGMEEEIVLELRDLCVDFEAYFCVEYNRSLYETTAKDSIRSYVESRDEVYVLTENGLRAITDLSAVEENQDIVFSAKAGSAAEKSIQ
jgi:FkbM family methyltransferase